MRRASEIRERLEISILYDYDSTVSDDVRYLLDSLDKCKGLLIDARTHLGELAEAWERGVLKESDGKGGTRSNRNHDVLAKVDELLKEL